MHRKPDFMLMNNNRSPLSCLKSASIQSRIFTNTRKLLKILLEKDKILLTSIFPFPAILSNLMYTIWSSVYALFRQKLTGYLLKQICASSVVTSNFSFSHSVCKRLSLQTRGNRVLFVKELNSVLRASSPTIPKDKSLPSSPVFCK